MCKRGADHFLSGQQDCAGADLFPDALLAVVALVAQAQRAIGRAGGDGAIERGRALSGGWRSGV